MCRRRDFKFYRFHSSTEISEIRNCILWTSSKEGKGYFLKYHYIKQVSLLFKIPFIFLIVYIIVMIRDCPEFNCLKKKKHAAAQLRKPNSAAAPNKIWALNIKWDSTLQMMKNKFTQQLRFLSSGTSCITETATGSWLVHECSTKCVGVVSADPALLMTSVQRNTCH